MDTLHLAGDLGWDRVSVVHPPAQPPYVPHGVDLLEQPVEGLGSALTFAFQQHFELGFESVVLIGSDNPTLTVEPILAADRALEEVDVAIGPTRDGGYYLIGMRQPWPRLFSDIEWSTPRVYAQTLRRASELNLRVRPVHEWFDVDEPADLDYLVGELARLPASIAPKTRALLRRWDQDGGLHSRATGIRRADAARDVTPIPGLGQDHD
jgi:rSAM/selenodomain-associated transferase 1